MALEEDFQPVNGLLIAAINRVMGREAQEENPPGPDDYIRASSFPKMCMREEVLCHREGVTRSSSIDADLELTFCHGTGLHHALQNIILPRTGIIHGHWRCRVCGHFHWAGERLSPRKSWNQKQDPPPGWKRLPERPWRESIIPRPDACGYCKTEVDPHSDSVFLFEEYYFRDPDLILGGHNDGFLAIEGLPGFGLLEAKSIGPGWKVKNAPLFDHVIQLHEYMFFAGVVWGVILYWEKGTNGIVALREHFVERDDAVIANITKTVKDARSAMRDPSLPLPERICAKSTCSRALACPVKKQCFAEGEKDAAA